MNQLLLAICTAYEQGFGHGLEGRSLTNPCGKIGNLSDAWAYGFEEGGRKLAARREQSAPDFTKLVAVYAAARIPQVDFSMHYCEGETAWYFEVDSPAPSERWAGQSHSFDIAVESVLEWLNGLHPACSTDADERSTSVLQAAGVIRRIREDE